MGYSQLFDSSLRSQVIGPWTWKIAGVDNLPPII